MNQKSTRLPLLILVLSMNIEKFVNLRVCVFTNLCVCVFVNLRVCVFANLRVLCIFHTTIYHAKQPPLFMRDKRQDISIFAIIHIFFKTFFRHYNILNII